MGRDHHAAPVAATPVPAHRAPAPGKRALTDSLPPRRAALVEHGTTCDRDPADDGCYLDPQRRAYAVTSLGHVVLTAAQNKHAAAGNVRLDVMTRSASGWSGLVDFLYYGATSLLIPYVGASILRAMGRVAAAAASRGADQLALRLAKLATSAGVAAHVTGTVTNGSRGVRKSLMNLAHSGPDRGKALFITVMQDGVKEEVDTLLLDASADLNDFELEVLIESYRDPEVHSVTAYQHALEAMLDGYGRNRLDDVGRTGRHRLNEAPDEKPDGRYVDVEHGRLVWAHLGSTRRLALLRVSAGQEDFVRWIDPPYHELAVNLYRERTGRAPLERDLDDAFVRRGCAWAEGSWLDAIMGCPGGTS